MATVTVHVRCFLVVCIELRGSPKANVSTSMSPKDFEIRPHRLSVLGVLLAFLVDFSLRHACRGTGESALEEFLWFGVVAALILARLQGHWGERFGGIFLDGFWQCRSCITIMGSKVDEVGPKMAPTQP